MAPAFLAATEALPLRSLDVLGGRGIVVIAPHPDDESLGCGGLIACARAAGLAVRLVVLSDGVGSHPNSLRYPPDRLRTLREEETLAAVAALGLDAKHVRFLRLPDRLVPQAGPRAAEAAGAIADEADACGAGSLFVTWRHDPHCDHQAGFAIAAQAQAKLSEMRLYAYPVWGWMLPGDTDLGTPHGFRLDVADYVDVKRAAIACHRSQVSGLIDDDPNGFRLTPQMLTRFGRPFELFLETAS